LSPTGIQPNVTRESRTTVFTISVAAGALTLFALVLTAAPVDRRNAGRERLAVKGYDVVAYFTEGAPRRGDGRFEVDWDGARWRFASADNRDRFQREPERYAPQYGGYCAYAVSRNYTADADPDAWHIENGRLYLNYSLRVRRLWREDVPGNIAKGDRNWPGLIAR
jgi:hypothetical protein